MKPALIIALLSWLLMTASTAQESSESETNDAAADVETSEVDEELEDDELLDLNTDHTEDDEGDFIPTDEISYQQSVPFPTDI